MVSGKFMRINHDKKKWWFDCEGNWHYNLEQFVTRQHPDGGYMLLVYNYGGFLAMRADILTAT